MADKKFMIKPEEVMKSINVINEKTQRFASECKKLYSETDALAVNWKGQTSSAFNADLEAYHQTIDEMQNLLGQFVQTLNTAVKTYENTDAELAGKIKLKMNAKG